MQILAELDRKPRLVRDIFSADEIGWVGADADVQAVLLGTRAGPLDGAHAKIDALGRVAAHPRLVRAVEAQLGHTATIEASAYWRAWDGSVPLLPEGEGQVALVFLGWRGTVGGFAAELGAVCWRMPPTPPGSSPKAESRSDRFSPCAMARTARRSRLSPRTACGRPPGASRSIFLTTGACWGTLAA
jgi:hypothetical protein